MKEALDRVFEAAECRTQMDLAHILEHFNFDFLYKKFRLAS